MKILAKTALGLVLTVSALAGASAPAAAQSYRNGFYGYDEDYNDGYRGDRYRRDWNRRDEWRREQWRREQWRRHHRHNRDWQDRRDHDWRDRYDEGDRRDWRRY